MRIEPARPSITSSDIEFERLLRVIDRADAQAGWDADAEFNPRLGNLGQVDRRRILVYRDEVGSIVGREKVADDADFDESDLRRLEYVIENRLDDEGAWPRQQWGLLVAFYRVDEEDRKVSLLSIYLMETRE
jgi:hypothetical protein